MKIVGVNPKGESG